MARRIKQKRETENSVSQIKNHNEKTLETPSEILITPAENIAITFYILIRILPYLRQVFSSYRLSLH